MLSFASDSRSCRMRHSHEITRSPLGRPGEGWGWMAPPLLFHVRLIEKTLSRTKREQFYLTELWDKKAWAYFVLFVCLRVYPSVEFGDQMLLRKKKNCSNCWYTLFGNWFINIQSNQWHPTVRFGGLNICSERHYPPQKFGLNCEDKLAFSLTKSLLKRLLLYANEANNAFRFRKGKNPII